MLLSRSSKHSLTKLILRLRKPRDIWMKSLQCPRTRGLLGPKPSFTPVESYFLRAVCPVCCSSFVLKGEKLKKWIAAKQKNPVRSGPYCNYKCSSRINVLQAHSANRKKFKKGVV